MRPFIAALILFTLCVPASASLQIEGAADNFVNNGLNNFAGFLDDFSPSLVKVVTGDVKVTQAGTLSFFAHASESGFTNTFHIFDTLSNEYTYTEHELAWNLAGVPIASFSVPANTLLSGLFASFTTTGTPPASSPGVNADIGDVGFGIFVSSTGAYDNEHLFFGYDDNGAGPDDNHDDLIVSVVFTPLSSAPPELPEPISGVVWGALACVGMLVSGRRLRS